MLNKYPLWKYALIVLVLVVGFIYSAPNLYPDDPAVQISGASSALQVNQADLDRVSRRWAMPTSPSRAPAWVRRAAG